MDDYQTPKVQRIREAEWKCCLTPIAVTEIKRIEDAKMLRVNKINMRSSTPIFDDVRSPGLSPCKMSPCSPNNHSAFKDPNKCGIKHTPIAKCNNTKPLQQQQSNTFAKTSPQCVINFSLTSPPDYMCDIFDGSRDSNNNTWATSDSSAENSSLNIFNRNLNVTMLLHNAGLEMYVDVFEKEGIDLERFLRIQQDDLLRMGLASEEHCKVLMDMQKDYK